MSEPVMPKTIDRVSPPLAASEREMLDSWLDFHRATLLTKCEGLTAEQLKTRSVPPSSMSLLGLVRHMTDVERHWFRRVLGAEAAEPQYYSDLNLDGEFDDVAAAEVNGDMTRFQDELDHCRRVAAEHQDLDVMGKGTRGGQPVAISLRWIYVHMIEEYARHNGHADFCESASTEPLGSDAVDLPRCDASGTRLRRILGQVESDRSAMAAYFDGWYADMANTPAKDAIMQRHLGLPRQLVTTSTTPGWASWNSKPRCSWLPATHCWTSPAGGEGSG